MLNINVLIYQM